MDNDPSAREELPEVPEGYRAVSCPSCGQGLEVPAEVDLGAMACPACRQPMAPSAATPPPMPPSGPGAGPTRLKTPSVLWRRLGALGADCVLSAALGISGTYLMTPYPIFMTAVASVIFGALWLGTAMHTGATPGMWLVELRHQRSNPRKPLPIAMAAKFALTWLPAQVLDILFQEHLAVSWRSPDTAPAQAAAPVVIFSVVLVVWYLLLLISALSTRGKRNLADRICATAVELSRARFLSVPRRITAWILSLVAAVLLVMANIFAFLHGSELEAPGSETPWTADPVAIYQPEEIHEAYRGNVLQVSTRWNRSMLLGFLKEQAGTSGSALLFVNDREYGLLVSNRHVIEAGSGYLDGYECVVENDLQSGPVRAEPVAFARHGIDLALLLIRVDNWEPGCVLIMPVSGLQVGEETVALGNALGMGISATTGNISHLDETESVVYIRTSAPISRGNSGGPLILTRGGYVCGINTMMRSDNSAQNMNFAIPAEYIAREELWEFGGDSPRAKALLGAARECLP